MNNKHKLKSIIDEIDDLMAKNVKSSSPEFIAWKTRAERFLISEYGSDSYEATEFGKMHFSLSVFAIGTPDSEFIDACKKGLASAKAVLQTYLDELKENAVSVDTYKKLQYEYKGIRDVISDYTDGGFIVNFLNELERGIISGDKVKIKYFLTEINNWYEQKWEEICNNKYVNNLEDHERNRELIKEFIDGIDASDISVNGLSVPTANELKEPIILLSHRSSDKKYGDALEKLFSAMGIKNDQLIYTSHPLHKIPLDKNIYEYLRESFGRKTLVIILWSNEYLDSPACLNEMGAVWATQTDYTNIYVPSFDFTNPKYYQCSVDKNKMGAILDGSDNCKAGIIELNNKIIELFGLSIDESQWIYSLDQFMKDITE